MYVGMINVFRNMTPCRLVDNTLIFSHHHKNLKSKILVLFYVHIFLISFSPRNLLCSFHAFFGLFPFLLFLFFASILCNIFQFLFFFSYSCLHFFGFQHTRSLLLNYFIPHKLILNFSCVNNNLNKWWPKLTIKETD